MASYVDFTLTFTDNSSGDRDELGTEVQIYSDSPSYKQTEPIDYAYARHGWMKLPGRPWSGRDASPSIACAGDVLTVRVRQFNAHGVGNGRRQAEAQDRGLSLRRRSSQYATSAVRGGVGGGGYMPPSSPPSIHRLILP